MMTNILASIIVAVVTNAYAPKQHLVTHHYLTYPPQVEDVWEDGALPAGDPSRFLLDLQPRERDNPDVRITEVREIRTISFAFEGKTFSAELSNTVLSRVTQRRVVKTDETWEDVEP